MEVCALASGSSGNCYYLEKNKEALLVDAGISAKQMIEKLNMIGKDANNVKGILITHEHSDHVRGADVIARKFKIPMYATSGTFKGFFTSANEKLIKEISNDEDFSIGNFNIRAIPKMHSAADPVSFLVGNKNKKVSFITDLGRACKETCEAVEESDFVFIEANHDVKMLEDGPYLPWHKKWILSDKGHLSNLQSSLCVLEYAKQSLGGIVLSHLSKINNTSQTALKTYKNILKERSKFNPCIHVSERDKPTAIFKV